MRSESYLLTLPVLGAPVVMTGPTLKHIQKLVATRGVKLKPVEVTALVQGSLGCFEKEHLLRSEWARKQEVHTFVAMEISRSDPIILLLSRQGKDGFTIEPFSKKKVPENYYEERVIDEAARFFQPS